MNIKTLDYKDNGCWETCVEEDKEVFLYQTKDTEQSGKQITLSLGDLPSWWCDDSFFDFRPTNQIVVGEKELIDVMAMQ